jgi:endonuclease-3
MAQKKLVEKLESEKERMVEILALLKKEYPGAHCSLTYSSPFQLLVATVLSAQCTDERVNRVTPALFERFPTPFLMAEARISEIEELVRSTGFFRSKAKSILELSGSLVQSHGGRVPADRDLLTQMRGVGRKTANVVLGVAFGVPALVVDTHVGRLSRRMGFTRQKDPVKVEMKMMEIVPKTDWTLYAHLLIDHGRKICTARKPLCEACLLKGLCPQVL